MFGFNRRVGVLQTIFAVVIGFGMSGSVQAKTDDAVFRYVITETGMATSFDPLDADSTNNLPVARMLYATPLESSTTNQLESQILESFNFDTKSRTIEWVVRKNLHFSDGTSLTPDDVAFAVARMAFARPKFPVISAIEGLEAWTKKPNALTSLPKGISVNGSKISIKFDQTVEHPLFRFCLELFSIIPKRCVDLSTNKVTCSTIPSSGRYTVSKREQSELHFVKHGQTTDQKSPSAIVFKYVKPADIGDQMTGFDQRTVIAGNELSFTAAQLAAIEKQLNTKFMPAARYAAIHINQNTGPFKDKACRKLFANVFRSAFADLFKTDSHEVSLFTKILPGYLSSEELRKSGPPSSESEKKCRDDLAKHKISWGFPEAEKDAKFFVALKAAFDRLGMKTVGVSFADRKEFADAFADGRVSFYYGGSGFWAHDPKGDVQMLFTPHLHKPLQHLSDDARLQELIRKLDTSPEPFRDLNQFIYADARLNIYTHVRRFFASKDKLLLTEVPFAITSPAPWQVFENRK